VPSRDLLLDPVGFWESRHAALDPWRSGGDRGLSREENVEFYAYRLGRLIELIRRHAGGERGLRIVDAVCGRGHLTNHFRSFGHRAVGFDASATAVAWATKSYGPHFTTAALDAYRPTSLADVVVCLDVLFHVLDDAHWRAAIETFGRSAAAESIVVVTDAFADTTYAQGNYIVHRDRATYDAAFAAADFTRVEQLAYDFGNNQNQFAVYRRRG
jgi:SAM-dependent methyltransferase